MQRRLSISYQNLWNTAKAIFRGKCIAYNYDSFVTERLIINEHSTHTKKFHEEQKNKPK